MNANNSEVMSRLRYQLVKDVLLDTKWSLFVCVNVLQAMNVCEVMGKYLLLSGD
jgi:hypothetical protein